MNEELQSTNEELEAINDELQSRTDELDTTNVFLESILGGLRAGVVVIDGELTITAWNHASQELWGLREEEVRGRNFFSLDIGLPLDKLRRPVRASLAGEDVDPLVLDATDRRGKPLSCTVAFSKLDGAGEEGRGVIIFVQELAETPADK